MIILTGQLAEKFAPEIPFKGKSVREALQCIEVNYPEFKAYLIECHENDIGFNIEVAGQSIDIEKDAHLNLVDGDIVITPVPAGSKSGEAKIAAAIALAIILSVAIGNTAPITAVEGASTTVTASSNFLAAAGSLTNVGQAVAALSVNLALIGIQQLLAPDPATEAQDEGYLFSGSEQSIVEGAPVPLLYGELAVPGYPISFELIPTGYHINSVDNSISYDGGYNANPQQTHVPESQRNQDTESGNVLDSRGSTEDLRYSSSQTVSFTDLISEGPIHGLVYGGHSILLNGDPAQTKDQSARHQNPGQAATIESNEVHFPTDENINVDLGNTHVTLRGIRRYSVGSGASSITVSTLSTGVIAFRVTLSSILTIEEREFLQGYSLNTDVNTAASRANNTARVLRDGVQIAEGYLQIVSNATIAVYAKSGTVDINNLSGNDLEVVVDQVGRVESVTSSTTVTGTDFTSIPDGTYNYDINGPKLARATDINALNDSAKFTNFSFEFRNGHRLQEPFRHSAGSGLGNTTLSAGSAFSPQELSLFETDNRNQEITYSLTGNEGFGVRSDLIHSIAEIQITFQYPQLYNTQKETGKRGPGTVIHEIFVNNVLYNRVQHIGDSGGGVIFLERIRFEPEFFMHLSDANIRIRRITHNDRAYDRGTIIHRDDYASSSSCIISHIATVLKENLYYPLTALAKVQIFSRDFQSVPSRAYHCKGLLISVPSNYRTRDETGGAAEYDGVWDGTLRSDKVYCNNPAWVLYDIITQKRYGLGDWIEASDLNLYAFYKVARYCDELVPDGKDGMEPRFTTNVYLRTKAEAYKVIKDLSAIFTGILYWLDGQVLPIADTREYPVYIFNNSNIIKNSLTYETVGTRTRSNQIVVSWNNPDNAFKIEPLIVEDSEDILRTGQIISQEASAFGATSFGQAQRYGRWKLWTARNQTEIVTFKTSISAAFLAPGDVIVVPKYTNSTFNGRIIDTDITNNRVRIDKFAELVNAGYNISDMACTLVLTNGVAKSIETESFTHTDGSTIEPGENIPNVTNELAAFNYRDQNGNSRELQWMPDTYVGNLTNGGIINGEAGWFDIDGETDRDLLGATWVTTSIGDSPLTNKEYRIVGVLENEVNDYTITAIEYFKEKFDSIDDDFILNVKDPVYDIPNPTDEVPPPKNVYVLVSDLDSGDLLNDATLYFDPPEDSLGNLYEYVGHYEIEHAFANQPTPIILSKDTKSVTGLNIVAGTHTIGMRTVSSFGNRSILTKTTFVIDTEAQQAVPRAYGIALGAVVSSNPVVTEDGTFTFENESWAISPIGNPRLVNTYTTSGSQNCSGLVSKDYNSLSDTDKILNSGYIFYDADDTSDPLKLILYYEDTDLETSYLYFSDTGAEDLTNAFETITGSISILANSVKVTGTNLTDNWKVGDFIKLSNTQWAKIAYIVDDTDMRIDRTFASDISITSSEKLKFSADKNNDCVFAAVRNNNGTFEYHPVNLTVNPELANTRSALFRSSPSLLEFAAGELITSYDNLVLQADALGFQEPEFQITGSGFNHPDISQTAQTQFFNATSGVKYTLTLDKVESFVDGGLNFELLVREKSDPENETKQDTETLNIPFLSSSDTRGIEYVYAAYNEESIPDSKKPNNDWGFDTQGTQDGLEWHDDAPGLLFPNIILFRSQRYFYGTPVNGSDVADEWTEPSIVGRLGLAGADARGIEYIFAVYGEETIPESKRPSNDWGYDVQGTVDGLTWVDDAPSITEENRFLHRSQRFVIGIPADGSEVEDSWTQPTLISAYGIQGEDGRGFEYKYAITAAQNSIPNNQRPDNTWGFDQRNTSSNGLSWTDGAPSVTEDAPYLWRSQRKIIGTPEEGDDVTDSWTTPTILAQRGTDGEDGVNAPGIEYIFAVTVEQVAIPLAQRPNNDWGYENPQSSGSLTWNNAAPSLTSNFPYLWRAERKVSGTPAFDSEVTDTWSVPIIVGQRGSPGADGSDARGIEYVFAAYNENNIPASKRPNNDWGFDVQGTQDGLEWHDDAIGLTADNFLLFRSQRFFMGTPMNGAEVADTWTTPTIIGRRGSAGESGEPARGVEYIYAPYNENTIPTSKLPSDSWGFNVTGTSDGLTWSSDAIGLTSENFLMFRSQRFVSGTPTDGTAITDTWSAPTIIARRGSPGERGQDARGVEYVFAVYNENTVPDSKKPNNDWGFDVQGTVDGLTWSDNAPGITEDNPILFRSQRNVVGIPTAGTEVTDTWTNPISVGTYGEKGEDARGFEYIYAVTEIQTSIPSNQLPSNSWGFDRPSTQNGLLWSDDAQTVSATTPLLWRSQRKITGNPSAGTEITDTWTTPIVIATRGEEGEDAFGFEYIFAATEAQSTIPANQYPNNTWGFQTPSTRNGLTWYNDAQPVTLANPYLWRSQRQIVGAPASGSEVTDAWSTPVIIAQRGTDGENGDDARGFEYKYALTAAQNSIPSNQLPLDSWGFDELNTANGGLLWTDAAQQITTTHPYLWRSERKVLGIPEQDSAVSDTWSTPVIIAVRGIDGEDGIDGDASRNFEYIYAIYNEETIPNSKLPSNDWGFEEQGTVDGLTWEDDAIGLSATNPILFRSQRTVSGIPMNGAEVTDTWTTPIIIGRVGQPGDTSGIEYVYAIYSEDSLPTSKNPSNMWGFEEQGTVDGLTWEDDAPGVTEDNSYLYRAQRKYTGSLSSGDEVTDNWTTPVIISTYGLRGEDARGYEYIYAVTEEQSDIPTNQRPSNTWGFDNPSTINGLTWSDDAPDVTQEIPILWRSQRKIVGTPEDNSEITDAWTTPIIFSRYGPEGEDGEDSRGVEYVFAVTAIQSSIPLNQLPSNDWGFETQGTVNGLTWSDDAQNVTEATPLLWRSQRKVVGIPENDSDVTDTWTVPVIVGVHGPKGDRGNPGDAGGPGPRGTPGIDAPRIANGYVYFKFGTHPGTNSPTGTFDFSTGILNVTNEDWSNTPPTIAVGTQEIVYVSYWTAIESGYDASTQSYTTVTLNFSNATAGFNFNGIVTFSSPFLTLDTDVPENTPPTALNTVIDGEKIKTGTISLDKLLSNSTFSSDQGSFQLDPSGSVSFAGISHDVVAYFQSSEGTRTAIGARSSGPGIVSVGNPAGKFLTSSTSVCLAQGTEAIDVNNGLFQVQNNGDTDIHGLFKIKRTGPLRDAFTIDADGDVTLTGELTGATVGISSDKRLKSNITKIDSALEKIEKIAGYTFDKDNKRQAGVIAQEVENVLPEAVIMKDDQLYVNYNAVLALCIEAIKELKNGIT